MDDRVVLGYGELYLDFGTIPIINTSGWTRAFYDILKRRLTDNNLITSRSKISNFRSPQTPIVPIFNDLNVKIRRQREAIPVTGLGGP
jgi:hypothetical protein